MVAVVLVTDAPPVPPLWRFSGESPEQALKCESKTNEIGTRQRVVGCMGEHFTERIVVSNGATHFSRKIDSELPWIGLIQIDSEASFPSRYAAKTLDPLDPAPRRAPDLSRTETAI